MIAEFMRSDYNPLVAEAADSIRYSAKQRRFLSTFFPRRPGFRVTFRRLSDTVIHSCQIKYQLLQRFDSTTASISSLLTLLTRRSSLGSKLCRRKSGIGWLIPLAQEAKCADVDSQLVSLIPLRQWIALNKPRLRQTG